MSKKCPCCGYKFPITRRNVSPEERQRRRAHLLSVRYKGSVGGNAKLTDEKALEIYNSTELNRVTAYIHKVSMTTVQRIKNKQAWQHIHR
jgi:hypothetical protein